MDAQVGGHVVMNSTYCAHMSFSVAKFNVFGRSQSVAITAISIDKPKRNGYEYKVLSTPRHSRGSKELHVLGLTGRDHSDSTVELLLLNNEPQIDLVTGEILQDQSTRANTCLLYTSPSPRDGLLSRMPSSA